MCLETTRIILFGFKLFSKWVSCHFYSNLHLAIKIGWYEI